MPGPKHLAPACLAAAAAGQRVVRRTDAAPSKGLQATITAAFVNASAPFLIGDIMSKRWTKILGDTVVVSTDEVMARS